MGPVIVPVLSRPPSILSREEAAAHLAIPLETLCKLQKVGVFPSAELTADRLGQILAELFKSGLPWPTPTRKSEWRSFPYCQPIWRKIEGGPPHLHVGWRHEPDAQPIHHPFGTGLWVRKWFACERRYAAKQIATATAANDSGIGGQSPTTAEPPHKAPPLAPKLARQTIASSTSRQAPTTTLLVPPIFLTPEDVCERWRDRVAVETLSNWRSAGVGPPATRIGRTILYRLDLLEAWEQQQLFPKPKS